MADVIETQLVVLGAGPGGYAAAFLAADHGQQVTLIDAMPRPGGTCLHVGCIPTKALLESSGLLHKVRDRGQELGIVAPGVSFDYGRIAAEWDLVDGDRHIADADSRIALEVSDVRQFGFDLIGTWAPAGGSWQRKRVRPLPAAACHRHANERVRRHSVPRRG